MELANAKVHYLVIGGYAVSFHARPRYTKDIDIWIGKDSENRERAAQALVQFGAPQTGVPVSIIAKEDLIKAKEAACRPQDLLDIEALKKAEA